MRVEGTSRTGRASLRFHAPRGNALLLGEGKLTRNQYCTQSAGNKGAASDLHYKPKMDWTIIVNCWYFADAVHAAILSFGRYAGFCVFQRARYLVNGFIEEPWLRRVPVNEFADHVITPTTMARLRFKWAMPIRSCWKLHRESR